MPVHYSNVFNHLNSQMRVILSDKRTFIGKFKAYDTYMNIILEDAVEYKKYKPAKTKTTIEVKKEKGIIILRGSSIATIIVESTGSSEQSSSRRSKTSSRR